MEISPSYIFIFEFALTVIFIYTVLKVINFFALRLLKKQKTRVFWNKYYSGFELLIWLIYALMSIEYFTIHNKIIAIVIAFIFAVVLCILLYFYFKELLIKVFFKLSTDIAVGDEVRNEHYNGKVCNLKATQLVIERPDGNRVSIPYSKIIFKPLIKQSPSPYLHRFESTFVVDSTADRNKIQQELKSVLYTDIRVSGGAEPVISFSELNKQTFQIKVIAFLFNPADTEPLRESLKTVLNE